MTKYYQNTKNESNKVMVQNGNVTDVNGKEASYDAETFTEITEEEFNAKASKKGVKSTVTGLNWSKEKPTPSEPKKEPAPEPKKAPQKEVAKSKGKK